MTLNGEAIMQDVVYMDYPSKLGLLGLDFSTVFANCREIMYYTELEGFEELREPLSDAAQAAVEMEALGDHHDYAW